MDETNRDLWAKRLALKDSLASSDLTGDSVLSKRLQGELEDVNSRLFRKQDAPPSPRSPREKFAYRIPLIDADSRRLKGHVIANEAGVFTPQALLGPVPSNSGGRQWLKTVEPTRETKEMASRFWRVSGHAGMFRCPGCRSKADLVYLEFRNGETVDRFKSNAIVAVCDEAAAGLIERAKGEIFGPSMLVKRIPWPCRRPELELIQSTEEASNNQLEQLPSLRGKHRNDRSMANLLPNGRKVSTT